MREIEAWLNARVAYWERQIAARREDYRQRNWRWSPSAVQEFTDRIALLHQYCQSMRQSLLAGMHDGDRLLLLGNIIVNEAGASSQDARVAVAYAWMNRVGGALRAPHGAEVSHYIPLPTRWRGYDDIQRLTFLSQFPGCLQAANQRLNDPVPWAHDPVTGATHWVSPIGLEVYSAARHGDTRYARTVGRARNRAFPLWARDHNTPEARAMQRAGTLLPSFREITAANVPREEFLFYRGVR